MNKLSLSLLAAPLLAAGLFLTQVTAQPAEDEGHAPIGVQAPAAPTAPAGRGAGRGGGGRAGAPALSEADRAEAEANFRQRCAGCHEPAVDRAPARAQMVGRGRDGIIAILTNGIMSPMAQGMTPAQIANLATVLAPPPAGGGGTRGPVGVAAQVDPPKCPTNPRFTMTGRNFNGWGGDNTNRRNQTNGGLRAADVSKLKVKWSFTFIGARYSAPSIVGGRLFMASGVGTVYSFDARNGCYYWRFNTNPARVGVRDVGVRTTIVIGALPGVAPSGYAAYFGDYMGNVYALDARSGQVLWKTDIQDHYWGVLSGSPVLYKDRLIVPTSGWEEITAATPNYECCTMRGQITSLDIRTGKIVWTTYMIPQAPQPTRKNAAGTQLYGPAGAAVWSTPTIDRKRNAIYVSTGNSYTEVPSDSTDAIVALDFDTGIPRWKNQTTPNDNYLGGCRPPNPAVNCPLGVGGPDHDFGSSPLLVTLPNGKDILIAGQKSSVVYGMDPDNGGAIVWQHRLGAGGALGGVEFGGATDGKVVYMANADTSASAPGARPGLFALDPATGRELWFTASPRVPCGWPTGGSRCVNGNSAAPVIIPGAILAATIDGRIRAYNPQDGKITWEFDAGSHRYQTTNGVKDQQGGNVDAGGAIVAEGMVFFMSGYIANMGGVPNNVLVAMSPDGR